MRGSAQSVRSLAHLVTNSRMPPVHRAREARTGGNFRLSGAHHAKAIATACGGDTAGGSVFRVGASRSAKDRARSGRFGRIRPNGSQTSRAFR